MVIGPILVFTVPGGDFGVRLAYNRDDDQFGLVFEINVEFATSSILFLVISTQGEVVHSPYYLTSGSGLHSAFVSPNECVRPFMEVGGQTA